ncbi:sigma-70 family RNA polymerase sigma factor [Halosquirtibacter laminarini]|uniref:Sigma-70 family RNA polymerase sigma factor n=1 Tax=Halosquirtibacter laminarini TaxID=3374600 RepID=A0AC61NPU1_9BACT|nr:sigma-70 family RNA polymerase sigma factor [Prolixibacteraceae bacterium]
MENLIFEQNLVELRPHLYNFALKLTKCHQGSEDLIQETFLKAWKYKGQYRTNTNFKAWVFTIMRNSFINNYRRNSTQRVFFDTDQYSYFRNLSSSGHEDQETLMSIQEIHKLIMEMKEGIRDAFLLFIQGYKYKEIAEKMDLPLGTVKSRIFFARKHLSKQIQRRA